jgi:hypothetical protein
MAFVLVLVLALASGDERAAFYAAAERGEAEPAAAVAELEALVARAPADAFADDALAEAARLVEEKLGDPARAARLYRKLLTDYPDSRLGRRAEARLEVLERNLGDDGAGAAAQAAWNDLLLRFPERSRAESIAGAEQLLAAYPDFADAHRVDLWVAEQLDAMGEPWQALARYQAVQRRHPGSDSARRARRAEADLLTAVGRWEQARLAYRELRASAEDPLEVELIDAAVDRLEGVRARAKLEWVAIAVGLLVLAVIGFLTVRDAGSLRGALRAFFPPPIEAVYFLPVAVVLGMAALTEDEAIGRATLELAVAGLIVAWLAGVGLRVASAGGRLAASRAAVHGIGGLLLVACAAYVIARRTGILELVIYTLTNHYD